MDSVAVHTERTSTGLPANYAAAGSYLVGFISGLLMLRLEKQNRFVRFHAMQSTIAFGILCALQVLLFLGVIPLRTLISTLVVLPLSVILWLVLMFKAYQGEEFSLPIVGPMAAERT